MGIQLRDMGARRRERVEWQRGWCFSPVVWRQLFSMTRLTGKNIYIHTPSWQQLSYHYSLTDTHLPISTYQYPRSQDHCFRHFSELLFGILASLPFELRSEWVWASTRVWAEETIPLIVKPRPFKTCQCLKRSNFWQWCLHGSWMILILIRG